MNLPISERGFFWWHDDPNQVPNSKQTSVPGLLSISELGEIKLKTFGRLTKHRRSDWVEPSRLPSYAKIQGQIGESLSYVLLEGIVRLDFEFSEERPQEQEFAIDWCLQGSLEFATDYKSDNFVSLEVEVDELKDWFKKSSLRYKPNYDYESVNAEDSVTYDRWTTRFTILDATTLTIGSKVYRPLNLFGDHAWDRIEFSEHFFLRFEKEVLESREGFLTLYSDVEEFLSLLLGNYHHLSWPSLQSTSGDFYMLHYKRSHPPSDDKSVWLLPLCPFAKLEEDLGKLFRTWLSIKNILSPAIQIYISAFIHGYTYAEDRFTVLAICIESLHRRWLGSDHDADSVRETKAQVQRVLEGFTGTPQDKEWLKEKLAYAHEPSLRKRIKECMRRLPLPFEKQSIADFAGICVNLRNDLAHEGAVRSANQQWSASDLATALSFVLHFLILHLIGMRDELLLDAATKSFYAKQVIEPAFTAVKLKMKSDGEHALASP